MIKYELKKMMNKRLNVLILTVLLGFTFAFSYFALTSSFYVNEAGVEQNEMSSVRKLTKARQKWSGKLTPELIVNVVESRQKIHKKYGDNVPNTVYGKEIQGYEDVLHFVNAVLRADGEYDSRAVLRLDLGKAKEIYQTREKNIEKMISVYGKTEEQRAFLNEIYDKTKTPVYYESYESWEVLYRYTNILGLIMALILTIPVAGIFSDEYKTGAASVFFSTRHGRKKAIWGKIGAAFVFVSLIYWLIMILFSVIGLSIMGISGHSVLYSINVIYSLYPLTFFQIHILILVWEYIACMFAATVTMLVVAKTRKSTPAIFLPFVLLAVSPFIARELPFKVFFQLTPDQLLNLNNCLRLPYLYQIGGFVFRQIPFIGICYLSISVFMLPLIFKLYALFD